jgi:hypothetical protein
MPFSVGVRRDAGIVAATLVLAALLYPGALLRGQSFFERDLHLDWYPRQVAIKSALGSGAWPLWDTSIGFGQPLLADPGAEVLYPVAWLALAVPLGVAYTVFVLVHLLVASVGAARLARAIGAGPIGAPLAALAFVLCGPVQSAVNLWHHFAACAWMPWVLLAVDRAVRRPSARATLALALVATVQGLAGSADVCAMTAALALGWAVFRLREARRRRLGLSRVLGGLVASGALATALTAGLWVPAADVLSRSARRALPEDIRTAWSVPAPGLLRLLVPLDPARVPFDEVTWRRLYDRAEQPFLASLYLGLPVLVLALAAPLDARLRRRALALLFGVLVCLAVALGPHAPLYPLAVRLFPPLQAFRYPSKLLLPASLLVALLAGLGAAGLARGRVGKRGSLVLGSGLLAGAAGVALVGRHFHARSLGTTIGLAGLAALLCLVRSRERAAPRLVAGALALVGLTDLLAAHAALNATAPAALLLEPPPVVGYVDRSAHRRLYVYDYHSLPDTAPRRLGRSIPYPTVPLPDAASRVLNMVALRLYLVPPAAGLFGLEGSYDLDIRGLYPWYLNDLTFFLRRVEGTPAYTTLLRMGAVGTVLSLDREGFDALRLRAVLPSLFPEPILVWRVPGAQPRSWVVGATRVADGAGAFDALLDPSFDPAREVLLAEGRARPAAAGFAGTSRIVRLASDRVTLEVEANGPGFVVVADAFGPGWRAAIDGHPVRVRRGNVAFRAVEVPAGRHRVDMVYRPRSVEVGLALSLAALIGTVVGVAVGRVRRARRRR